MDGILGVMDGSFKLSIVDSTMMWIVHRAMDKAHGRVKSREGVIERLHEISKFYELSVMQLDGCIKFVQEETDTHNPDSSHEEVLAGLAEIRNRLQRRLYESELAILQKDRELADRFESESKLRQALEITERELVSSQEDLELARSRSRAGSPNLSPREGENENRDEEFCELKDSVDRQVWKIREKLEFDDYEPPLLNRRNHCTKDVKVEEMGSDIDILKETLDIAFGKMQTAIFFSEMGPIEQQIKSSIENDVISISLKGFVRDSNEDLEAEARRKEKKISASMNEHWSDLMNEVTGLCEDLKPLITQNQNGEECNILDFGSRSPKTEEKNSQVDYLDNTFSECGINNDENELEELVRLRQEMLQEKTSLSSRTEESPVSLKRRFQEVVEKVENLMILKAKVNKSLGQNGDVNEEGIPLKKGKQVFTENNRQKLDVETLADVWGQIQKLQDEENIRMQNQICMLRQEIEDREFQNIMMEEIYITLFKGLIEEFCSDLSSWELEILISDGICRDFIRNMFSQWDETMEISYKIEAQIKDDITTVILKELQKSIGEYTTESLLREEISLFIFGETAKSITYKANHCPQTKFFNDFLSDFQIKIQEDVCLVFFREMVGEWDEKMEACTLETLIREEICYTILDEAEREVCDRYKKVAVPRERFGEGTNTGLESLIQKLNLLSEGIEEVENLVLISSFEIMDDKSNLKHLALERGFDESKATSVESKDIQCILNSLSNKLEKTMKLFNNKFIVGGLKSSLETVVSEPEKVSQISHVDEHVRDRQLSLSEHHVQLNKSDSKCQKLLEFPQIFYDFELMANKKLEAITLRSEEMKHNLDPLPQVMASLRENESLYKKAFIRRCQNLRKAENEVDLLGDQVDILLSLIEKIYLILNQHSPVLQQYFDVSEILRLIKEEVAAIVCTPTEKLDTSSEV